MSLWRDEALEEEKVWGRQNAKYTFRHGRLEVTGRQSMKTRATQANI